MNMERPSNGMSVMALTSKFMYDYLKVYGIKPLPVEMEILKAIDREFIRTINGRVRNTSNKGGQQPSKGRK